MASTIMPGDRVLVNKFRAGCRLPVSIIGLPGPRAPYADLFRLPYLRLPALKKIQRQDVIAFNSPAGSDIPLDRKKILISRLVGLPGDTVLVWDKQLYINRGPVTPSEDGRMEYRVVTKGKEIGEDFLKEFRIEKPRLVADIGIYDFDLTPEAKASLEKNDMVETVRSTKQYAGDTKGDYYPPSPFYAWNRDQFGPLIVPAKGARIAIEIKTVDLYRDIIEVHEGHELIVDFRGVSIDGKISTEYTFSKDYCFVMDDNRDNPQDSRKIGFIPMDHVLGVSHRILWNGKKQYDYLKKIQPDRILKRIH
jgi:signal peptidase I